ncbi:MAG TPA: sodium-translocating pyrophosphatase [Candidatus Acidoferrales bacterium]|nr:sodium-translocating pyrophosphatase [Candidatus Acidoferrales bacterium]
MILFVIAVGAASLIVAGYLARYVLQKDSGTEKMQEISNAIKEGAEAFLARQNKTIIGLAVLLGALIFVLYGYVRSPSGADSVPPLKLAFWTTLSFVFGALCSVVAGYVGMWVSIRANIRTAAAVRHSLNDGLRIALRGGAVSGLFVVAMSLLGIGGLYATLELLGQDPRKIPFMIVGYGFGASFVALFAQLGGGIYTKAADIGADLVGKVEAGIPEDDPRNPAVIADLVGDNVGDCAGRGADLFESTAAENIGAMILGVALYPYFGSNGILFPLVTRAFGLIASIIGVLVVKTKEDGDPMAALNRGYYVASALALAGFFVATRWLMRVDASAHPEAAQAWFYFFLCGLIGILTSQAFVYITQYYTDYRFRPVKWIAESSQTGAATNIISGIAVGLECTAKPVIVISAALIGSYHLGSMSGVAHAGLFGTAIATMGMLGTAAYILAMDTFGPITDNAGGIVQMSHQPEEIRRKTDRLDAVGNTTKALTKGYAIGSAALASFLLFSAYLDEVAHYGLVLEAVNLAKPEVFVGGLLGAMLVFLFSALAIRAVGKAAFYVIGEVRAQFREKPGILHGTARPNYGRCVDIVTVAALKAMVLPGILAVAMPVCVGMLFRLFGLGAEAVAAFLMVGTIGGILVATFFNNGGGAWDNAKKFIEAGHYGGKGSESHKASVVGDTVGDPFKDTAGPSLHVLIKLLSTVTLVLAPFFV